MHKILAVILLSATNIILGQAPMSCEKGSQHALKDFKNKKYSLQILGQEADKDFDPVLVAYAKSEFSIRVTGSGCMVTPETNCYSRTMRAKVFKKFGSDIETRIRNGALSVFKKSDKYHSEIKPMIDTGFVFYSTHTQAAYPGSEAGLRSFLCNTVRDTQKSYWTALVTFVVEKDGSVSNLEFTKELTPEAKTEVERAFRLMDKWTPATYYGEKVRSRQTYSISSKRNMEMMEDIRLKQNAKWQQELLQKKQMKPKQKRPQQKKIQKRNSAK